MGLVRSYNNVFDFSSRGCFNFVFSLNHFPIFISIKYNHTCALTHEESEESTKNYLLYPH